MNNLKLKGVSAIKTISKQKLNSGRDYFIQELVNDTDIPRSTVERYLYEYLNDEVEIYYEGPLKKIRYKGRGN